MATLSEIRDGLKRKDGNISGRRCEEGGERTLNKPRKRIVVRWGGGETDNNTQKHRHKTSIRKVKKRKR